MTLSFPILRRTSMALDPCLRGWKHTCIDSQLTPHTLHRVAVQRHRPTNVVRHHHKQNNRALVKRGHRGVPPRWPCRFSNFCMVRFGFIEATLSRGVHCKIPRGKTDSLPRGAAAESLPRFEGSPVLEVLPAVTWRRREGEFSLSHHCKALVDLIQKVSTNGADTSSSEDQK